MAGTIPTLCAHGRATRGEIGSPRDRLPVSAGDRLVHQGLRFFEQALQMRVAVEALGVDLVDLLGARRPRRNPAALRTDADAADGRAVAGRLRDDLGDGLAGDLPGRDR